MDLKGIIKGSVRWNDVVQNRDEWRAFVNKAMKTGFPNSMSNLLTR